MDLESQPTLAELVAAIHGLNDTVRAQQGEINRLRMEQGDAATPTSPVHTAAPASRPRARMPELDKFSGDRRDFRNWSILARQKLAFDMETLGGDSAAFAYLFARLASKAQALVATHFVREEAAGRHNPWAFLEHLKSIFGDRELEARAIQRLLVMKKNAKESFAAFFPKFERELADAGFDSAADNVRKTYLERAIDDGLARACVGHSLNTYEELVAGLFKISGQLERIGKWGGPQAPTQNRSTGTSDKMDWEPSNPRAGAAQPSNPSQRAKWVTKEELGRRRENDLCLRCGNGSHKIASCPQSPAKRPENKEKVKKGKKGSCFLTKAQVEETAEDPTSSTDDDTISSKE